MGAGLGGSESAGSARHRTRPASDLDYVRVAEILGDAFTHDPVLNWFFAKPLDCSTLFRAEIESHYGTHGLITINQEETGAALWLPPNAPVRGSFHWRLFHSLWMVLREGGYEGLKKGGIVTQTLAKHRPSAPHFYLHAIGACMDHQGQGIGSALLGDGLALCDERGMPAYLECTNPLNLPLYARHGFEVVGEERLPEEGPKITFMHRSSHSATEQTRSA